MTGLRKFLRVCYGYLATIFVMASFTTVPEMVRMYRNGQWMGHQVLPLEPWQVLIGPLIPLVFLIPVPLAVCSGGAWWTLRQNRASARRWSIATSLLCLAVGAFFAGLTGIALWYHAKGGLAGLYVPVMIMLSIGIAGLVAFWRRDPAAIAAASVPPPIRVSGDGTSRFFDVLAWILGVGGAVLGMDWFARWGYDQGLKHVSFLNWWLLLLLALFATTTLHELGHAVTGIALGMKPHMFHVGPFKWRIREGRWRFEFVPAQFFGGGSTGLVPASPNQSRWIYIAVIAAGPLASLTTGLIALRLLLLAPDSSFEQAWELFGLMSAIALSSVLVNLVPFRPQAFYSDGAQIYQLISGGPWADLHRVFSTVLATCVTPLRPRGYDLQLIRRAESHFTRGPQALSLRLITCAHFFDSGNRNEAEHSIADAVHVSRESNFATSPEVDRLVVYFIAVLSHEANTARQWWDRSISKKPKFKGFDYHLSLSALLWLEGRTDDAEHEWQEAAARAAKLPACGDTEFDCGRLRELRRLLDEPALAEPSFMTQAAVVT